MPGRIDDHCSIKCVAVPSPHTAATNPGIPGTGLVFDPATAKVNTILNQSKLTAVRTAIGCLVASKNVVKEEEVQGGSKRLVVLGTGAQAIWHARVFLAYYDHLNSVHFVGRASADTEKGKAFLEEAKETLSGLERKPIISLSTYEDDQRLYAELGGADLICCCTPSKNALFDWNKYTQARASASSEPSRSVHFSMIGSYKPDMQEVPTQVIQEAQRNGSLYVDSVDACLHEAGDLIKAGIRGEDCVEIGNVINKKQLAGEQKTAPRKISVFKSVGVAVQDVTITQMVVDQARKLGVGQWVDF